jgi:hypothetical protein
MVLRLEPPLGGSIDISREISIIPAETSASFSQEALPADRFRRR